jgi:hypothetical protein
LHVERDRGQQSGQPIFQRREAHADGLCLGAEVVINGGTANNLKNGDKFLLYRIGPDVLNPETNESLGRLEIVLGYGEIVHAQESMSSVRSTMREKKRTFESYMKTARPYLRPSQSSILSSMISRRELKEEIVPGDTVLLPFKNVIVGDNAKKLDEYATRAWAS